MGAASRWTSRGNPTSAAMGVSSARRAERRQHGGQGNPLRHRQLGPVGRSPPTRRAAPSTRCTTRYTPLGGLIPLVDLQLGEVVFGGVGSGLYGMLMAVLTVFIAGLMVGPHAGVSRQEDRIPRDEARDALRPDLSGRDSVRDRGCRGPAGGTVWHLEPRARTVSRKFSTRTAKPRPTTAPPSPDSTPTPISTIGRWQLRCCSAAS